VLAQRAQETAPPQADPARERGADEAVARGMLGGERAPAAVFDAHEGAVTRGGEGHLDDRLFVRLEVDAAPLEREPTRRIPLDDGADLEDACSGGELGGLEEAPAEARFEHDAPRALSGDAEAPATAPPEIDLVREDVEGVVDGNRHVNRRSRRVAHRGAHRRPRFAEAPATRIAVLSDESPTVALIAALASPKHPRRASPFSRTNRPPWRSSPPSLRRSTRDAHRHPPLAGLPAGALASDALRRAAPRALGVGLERGELFAPERLDVLDPGAQLAEGLACEMIDADARVAFGHLFEDEAALTQNAEVAAEPRRRRAEGVGELPGALRSAPQELDGRAPRRIRERGEGAAQAIVAQLSAPRLRKRSANHQWWPPMSRHS